MFPGLEASQQTRIANKAIDFRGTFGRSNINAIYLTDLPALISMSTLPAYVLITTARNEAPWSGEDAK